MDDRPAVEAGNLPAQGELKRAAIRPRGLPDRYEAVEVGRTLLVAEPDVLRIAVDALESAGTLYGYAASLPDAVRMKGRGVVYGIEVPGGRWAVRHSRRGGLVARWLGDRYLRAGVPRPIRELAASDAARRRGVATPRVIAVAIYPAGIFYRADVITEYIPDAVDLAGALFGPAALTGEDRVRACEAAGRLVAGLGGRGLVHPDLNLKNILVVRSGGEVSAVLLDLDQCRMLDRVSHGQRARMRRRLLRSLEKWQFRTGRRLSARERAALDPAGRE